MAGCLDVAAGSGAEHLVGEATADPVGVPLALVVHGLAGGVEGLGGLSGEHTCQSRCSPGKQRGWWVCC